MEGKGQNLRLSLPGPGPVRAASPPGLPLPRAECGNPTPLGLSTQARWQVAGLAELCLRATVCLLPHHPMPALTFPGVEHLQ